LQTEVEYITEIQKIIDMGVMMTPVLAINHKPVLIGELPEVYYIKEIIQKFL